MTIYTRAKSFLVLDSLIVHVPQIAA